MRAGLVMLASAVVPPAEAGSFQVSPVTVEMEAPSATSLLTFRNGGTEPARIQVRVFRWMQDEGEDRLERTRAIAASPPFTTVDGGAENFIRVVRVSREPVIKEESYRIFVDQLPDSKSGKGISLKILMRHSIPVFVSPPGAESPKISWKAERRGNELLLSAVNSGGRRFKISLLRIKSGSGGEDIQQHGLVGYVLAGGRKTFSYEVQGGRFKSGDRIEISGESDVGSFTDSAKIH